MEAEKCCLRAGETAGLVSCCDPARAVRDSDRVVTMKCTECGDMTYHLPGCYRELKNAVRARGGTFARWDVFKMGSDGGACPTVRCPGKIIQAVERCPPATRPLFSVAAPKAPVREERAGSAEEVAREGVCFLCNSPWTEDDHRTEVRCTFMATAAGADMAVHTYHTACLDRHKVRQAGQHTGRLARGGLKAIRSAFQCPGDPSQRCVHHMVKHTRPWLPGQTPATEKTRTRKERTPHQKERHAAKLERRKQRRAEKEALKPARETTIPWPPRAPEPVRPARWQTPAEPVRPAPWQTPAEPVRPARWQTPAEPVRPAQQQPWSSPVVCMGCSVRESEVFFHPCTHRVLCKGCARNGVAKGQCVICLQTVQRMSDEDGYFDIDKKTCPICLRRSSAYALDACGHMGTCEECFHLGRYPICTRKRRDGTFCGRSAQNVIRVIR